MRATTFEFRYRVWIITAIFWLSFLLYFVDRYNAIAVLLRWLSRTSGHAFNNAFGFHLAFAVSALIAAGASMLRTWATAYIRATVVHDTAIHAELLLADGPYRHLRNPLYLGTWLLAVSIGFFASRTGFFVLISGILVFVFRLILREEAELSAGHSEAYRQYRSRVPRLIPSVLPRVAAGRSHGHWLQAFLGESMMWVMTAGIVVFAATLRSLWFYVFLGASFPVSFVLNSLLRRREAAMVAAATRI